MNFVPAPRRGAMHIADANDQGLDNADCIICPRKWVGRQEAATNCYEQASVPAKLVRTRLSVFSPSVFGFETWTTLALCTKQSVCHIQ